MRTQLSFDSALLSLQSEIQEKIFEFEQKWVCAITVKEPTMEQLRLEQLRFVLSVGKSAATPKHFNFDSLDSIQPSLSEDEKDKIKESFCLKFTVICNPEKKFEEYVMVKEEDYDDKLSFSDYVNKGFPIRLS